MNAFDLSPLFRTTVGFDRINRVLDNLAVETPSYPPYNIVKSGDDQYRVTMAVAGFAEEELEVGVKENTLTVSGSRDETRANGAEYLHRGIANRSFERRFRLDEHIRVSGATLVNGLLHVDLVREIPEEKKPLRIAITSN